MALYPLDTLLFNLRSARSGKPLPSVSRREIWQRVDEKAKAELLAMAGSANRWDMRLPLFSEDPYSGMEQRRDAIKLLTMALCLTDDSRYLETLANAMWSVSCEPAWSTAETGDVPDLATCETAALLATALALIGEAFPQSHKAVCERARSEIARRVLLPVARAKGKPFTEEHFVENAVFAVLEALVYSGWDGEERWGCLRNTMRALEAFKSAKRRPHMLSLEENIRVTTANAEIANLLYYLSSGTIDCTEDRENRQDALLACAQYAGNGWFFNVGKGYMRPNISPDDVFHLGKAVGSAALTRMAACLLRESAAENDSLPPLSILALEILDKSEFRREIPKEPLYPYVFASKQRFCAARGGNFTVALHAGSFEHADAGDFNLLYRNLPVFIDLGETQRGDWHNVPVAGEFKQMPGYLGKDAEIRPETRYTALSLALTDAYDRRSNLLSWQRTVMLALNGEEARLIDMFEFERESHVAMSFITPYEPRIMVNTVRIGSLRMQWDGADMTPTVDDVHPRTTIFGETVYRLSFKTAREIRRGTITFNIQPAVSNNTDN